VSINYTQKRFTQVKNIKECIDLDDDNVVENVCELYYRILWEKNWYDKGHDYRNTTRRRLAQNLNKHLNSTLLPGTHSENHLIRMLADAELLRIGVKKTVSEPEYEIENGGGIESIFKNISEWNDKLKASNQFSNELKAAHNFVTESTLQKWTYCKSVGLDGNYYNDGEKARKRLENIYQFVDMQSCAEIPSFLREKVSESFRKWKSEVSYEPRIDREIRLYVPPLKYIEKYILQND
jgi:hypothetical protein